MPPYFIGQCCVDQIIAPPDGGSDASGKNEIVLFTNVSSVTIAWNATRKARFGDAMVCKVEILGEDGQYRDATVEIKPNNISNTTSYNIDMGGIASGRIVIT